MISYFEDLDLLFWSTRNILVQLKFNLAEPLKIYKVFSLGLSLHAKWCHHFFLIVHAGTEFLFASKVSTDDESPM